MKGRPNKERPTLLSNMITQRRLSLGLSQIQTAKLVGIDLRDYQRLEYGEIELKNIRFVIGMKLCMILGLNPYEIMFGLESSANEHESK